MEEIREIYCVIRGQGITATRRAMRTRNQSDVKHSASHGSFSSQDDGWCVPWYIGTMTKEAEILVERVQTGVRIEKRLLKVLKAFAEYHDLTLGDLLEGIVLHAFDGKTPFSQRSLERIRELKKFYGLELDSRSSHRLKENENKRRSSR
jgi:hypothetical protein